MMPRWLGRLLGPPARVRAQRVIDQQQTASGIKREWRVTAWTGGGWSPLPSIFDTLEGARESRDGLDNETMDAGAYRIEYREVTTWTVI